MQRYKTILKKQLENLLALMAGSLLRRHKPYIVGITGSVGKTGTKDAIVHVLQDYVAVRGTMKNYNNEIGIPLTIIGADTGGSSFFGWCRVFVVWVKAMFSSDYPDVLVLEYGIDRPGDMDTLVRIAPPTIAVVTTIAHVHQEFFESLDEIAREKGKLVEAVSGGDDNIESCAILNGDDHRVKRFQSKTAKHVYMYGMKDGADFQASHVMPIVKDDIYDGISFKIDYDGKSMPVRLPHISAEHHIFAVLSAIAVGHIFKMNFVDIAQRLTSFMMPPGRLCRIDGIHESVILDDTYNASKKSTIAAIETLSQMPAKRRIAFLGDMLELGAIEKKEHDKVMQSASKGDIDVMVAVGHRMGESAYALESSGYVLGETLFILDTPMEASELAKSIVKEKDLVLVKGSQGMRMEKVVEALLADPAIAKKVLCRQDVVWKEKPFVQP